MYTIITENDESQWLDRTGEVYHFPKRYRKHLPIGAKVIYYKGQIKNSQYRSQRLSDKPHYFGIATISKIYPDQNSKKNDFFAEISNYYTFPKAVLAKVNNKFIEKIPANRISNYWRDAVRPIDEEIYQHIISESGLMVNQSLLNDASQGLEASFESEKTEGTKKYKYSSYYERNPKLRKQALLIHGLTCKACGLNFENKYGILGKGFIHVHHLKPISESGETKVNPESDMVVLCANCHAMVHRQKDRTLTIEELITVINEADTT